MTSRERVVKAINHIEPDRVPVDIGGSFVTGIHMDEYCEIVKNLGLSLLPPRLMDQFLMVVEADIPVLKWLGSDVVGIENLYHNFGIANKDWHTWTTNRGNTVLIPGGMQPFKDKDGYTYIRDAKGEVCARMAPSGDYMDKTVDMTMSEEFVLADPDKWRKSLPLMTDEELRLYEKRASFFYNYTDYAVNGSFCSMNLWTFSPLAGHNFTDWVCLVSLEPEYVESILHATVDWMLENLKMYLEATGKYLETIVISTADFGSQKCELINPDSFHDLYIPAYKRLNDYVHNTVRAKTFFHSCGSVRNIIPYMIEAGVDILNPVQTTAGGMDAKELKTEFGDKIVFWGGGADSQNTLPNGTPEDVRREVKERLDIFKPGGGYVFTQVHNLQCDVPFE
ncbi:MAG: hypothetical protein IJD14_03470, partial [Christensenellaceae bacterium]|nr:hypothetical protein [Christensenellaceae bacterium]